MSATLRTLLQKGYASIQMSAEVSLQIVTF